MHGGFCLNPSPVRPAAATLAAWRPEISVQIRLLRRLRAHCQPVIRFRSTALAVRTHRPRARGAARLVGYCGKSGIAMQDA